MKLNKLSVLFCLSACIALLPVKNVINSEPFASRADGVVTDTINLGSFDLTSGKFKDATATELNSYNCATISLASSINGNETIILPTVDGYTIEADVTTTYSKVISMSSPKTAKQILEEYVSEIIFFNCNKQKLSIILSNEVPTNKVGYFSDNQHYYMFIEDIDKKWDEAYEVARGTTFLGRQGYLATITSIEEDSFIYKITDGCVGWLGGTTMKHSDTPTGQYYDDFDTEQPKDPEKGPDTGLHYVGYWYWACGPEIGEKFFDVISVPKNDAAGQTEIYERNANTNNYYFNWNTHPSGAFPWNQKLDEYEPNANFPIENCLTTLNSGGGYNTNNDISNYSWNNINSDLYGVDKFGAKGYVVEFGDLKIGDSHSDLSSSYVSSVFTFHSHSNDNFTEWTSKTSLPTEPGSYFLSDDVILTEPWDVPEGNVKLCLGGHLIVGNGTFTLLNVTEDSNLILTSCDDDIKHNGYTDEKLVWHSDPLNNHVLGDGETDYPLYGAVIAGGKTGINVDGSLYADSIRFSGNIGENGGAFYISETGECTLQTVRIEFNEAENGAGIYNDGTLAIFDTYISENYVGSEGHGGAIYHNGINPLTLGGVDTFSSNGYDHSTDNLYFLDGKKIALDEEMHPIADGETSVLFDHEKGEGIICDYLKDPDLFSNCFYPVDMFITGMSFVTYEEAGDGYSAHLIKAKIINNNKIIDDSATNNGYLEDDFYGVAFAGYPVTITVTAEPGYMLKTDSLVVNNGDIELHFLSETNSSTEWTASYWFSMPNEEVTMDCEFVEFASRLDNSITNATINNGQPIEYGSTFDIDFDAAYGKDTFEYYFYDENTYEYYDGLPSGIGTYSLIIIIPGTDEYAGATLKIGNVEIVKCQNAITELILEDWEYGATPNTPQIVAKAGTAEYTYSTSESGPFTSEVPTEVGTYYVKAVIEGTDNYTGTERITEFSIIKNTAEITSFTMENWVYGETPKTPSINKNFGEVTYLYSTSESGPFTSEVPTEVGTYYVKAVIEDTEKYTGTEKITQFSITKNTAEITSFTMEDWIYGEDPKTPSITKNFGEVTYLYSAEETGTYTSDIPTNVGTYYVKAVIEGTDKYTGTEKITEFSITKNTAEITSFTMEDWIYGEDSKTPSITKNFGEVTYLYSTSESGPFTSEVPTEVGTYYVKAVIEGADNYTGAEKITSFKILPASNPIIEPSGCNIHFILLGVLAAAIVVLALQLLVKYNAFISYVLLGVLDLGGAIFGTIGLLVNKCMFCLGMLIANVLLITAMILFVFYYSEKRKEDKDERKAK